MVLQVPKLCLPPRDFGIASQLVWLVRSVNLDFDDQQKVHAQYFYVNAVLTISQRNGFTLNPSCGREGKGADIGGQVRPERIQNRSAKAVRASRIQQPGENPRCLDFIPAKAHDVPEILGTSFRSLFFEQRRERVEEA